MQTFWERLGNMILDGLQGLGQFISGSFNFILGLVAAITVGAIPGLIDLADDLTTFKDDMISWPHIIKILAAGVLPAVGTYIGGRQRIQIALATPPPSTK